MATGKLSMAGTVLSICLYIPLLVGIYQRKITQSFATWILWVLLDAIALATTLVKHGNYAVLASYVCGGTIVWVSLLVMKQFRWGLKEWLTLGMVLICLIIWYFSGPTGALVASTIAVFLAGWPQLKESWLEPDRHMALIYLGYALANFLSFSARKSWELEEWFYYAWMVVLCLIIAFAASRKPAKQLPRLHVISTS